MTYLASSDLLATAIANTFQYSYFVCTQNGINASSYLPNNSRPESYGHYGNSLPMTREGNSISDRTNAFSTVTAVGTSGFFGFSCCIQPNCTQEVVGLLNGVPSFSVRFNAVTNSVVINPSSTTVSTNLSTDSSILGNTGIKNTLNVFTSSPYANYRWFYAEIGWSGTILTVRIDENTIITANVGSTINVNQFQFFSLGALAPSNPVYGSTPTTPVSGSYTTAAPGAITDFYLCDTTAAPYGASPMQSFLGACAVILTFSETDPNNPASQTSPTAASVQEQYMVNSSAFATSQIFGSNLESVSYITGSTGSFTETRYYWNSSNNPVNYTQTAFTPSVASVPTNLFIADYLLYKYPPNSYTLSSGQRRHFKTVYM
jgi:hypothetical protein